MSPVRRLVWTYPEWWAWALCASAWGVLLLGALRPAPHHQLAQSVSLVDWTVMVIAMMVPLVAVHLRVTAARSLWRRRHRAMAGFLCGYTFVWFMAGVALATIVRVFAQPIQPSLLTIGAFAIAAAWELTATKRRALSACHAMLPLTPTGWRADVDTLRYGSYVGSRCFAVCGLSMIGCAVSGHSLVLMSTVSGVLYATRHLSRSQLLNALAIACIAAGLAFLRR